MPTLDESMAQQKKNCNKAVITLSVLIDSPPVEKSGSLRGEVFEAWRRWHEEVKAGQRTFRFVGDPTEYDLNGPAPKEKLERIARDRKRDAERVAGHKKAVGSSGVSESTAEAVSSKSIPTAILIAAMVLLVSMYVGSISGGLISATLLRMPGTPASMSAGTISYGADHGLRAS